MKLQPREFSHGEFVISSNAARLDLVWVHTYLANQSYWARGISYQVFQKSVENSLCFGVYYKIEQIGFARVISDFATFAFLADVFIAENQQGKGLGKWLLACVLGYPELQDLRRWMLLTKDAHGLYEQYGFTPVKRPGDVMEWLPS
jgi:GNAT superfamily N-acetyltransferase